MACVSTHELVSVGDTLSGSQAWNQTWTMCSAWSEEEAEDGQQPHPHSWNMFPTGKIKLFYQSRGEEILRQTTSIQLEIFISNIFIMLCG